MKRIEQLEQVKEVGQHRKVLEVEKEDTAERRLKSKVGCFLLSLPPSIVILLWL
jgi:hypothetical protein